MARQIDTDRLKALIEAALFMTNEPISLEELSKMLKHETSLIKNLIDEMRKEFAERNRGVHILETSTGYQMKVKPEYAPLVRHLTPYQDLSRGLLRVLALVAYKQPITQSEIVKVIGNRGYEYVKKLEERGLIRTEKRSRTKALIATKGFAEYFGLESPEDIKKFFEKMTEEKK